MSISFLKQPADLSFSRNPVVYQLKSDALYKQAGKPFTGKLFIDFYAPDFFTFSLAYGDQKLQVTVAPNPDDSGYQLPARGNTPTAEAWMNQIADGLNGNFNLNRDFLATVDGNGTDYWVVITARRPGAVYTITATGPTDGYFAFNQLQAAEERIPNPNFRIYYELWTYTPESPVPAMQCGIYLDVDDNGVASIDLGDQLSGMLQAGGFDQPDYTNALVNQKSVCRYYLRYAEVYGSVQVIRQLKSTATRVALLGGFSKELQAGLSLPSAFQAGSLLKFFTAAPAYMSVVPEQAQYLTLVLLNSASYDLHLRFVIYFTDGSSQIVGRHEVGYQEKYNKITFPVGLMQNGLHTYQPDKIISRYEVLAADQSGVITETRNYQVNYDYLPYLRQFVYLGSLGAYETLTTYGKGSTQYELTMQSAERVSPAGFKLIAGEQVNYASSLVHSESVASGYQGKAVIRQFRDLALSLDQLLWRKGRIYPVALSTNSIKEFKDGAGLYAVSFEFGYRFSDELYTVDSQDDQYQPFLIQ
ncbi:hypothetical protein [Mucilaginibacter sp. CSA2-8R]|uniref:hypothetical protein n=1 Tax=Mucilaginibacter sp. CSA2-8R TaxID=3141542 RepID=UPI00315C5752